MPSDVDKRSLSEAKPEQLRYFLQALRQARYAALKDAEDFTGICFVLEELGSWLCKEKRPGLGKYKVELTEIIEPSSQDSFSKNLTHLIQARNDKSHQGIYARNSVKKAVAVCLKLEEEIMSNLTTIEDIMVENIIFVKPFMSLSKVREIMLANSFSFVPIEIDCKLLFLEDRELARVWHKYGRNSNERNLSR